MQMNFTDMSCKEFTEVLASKAPVPGGGGASALAGALGTALGSMVGQLTLGKKKVCRGRVGHQSLDGEGL